MIGQGSDIFSGRVESIIQPFCLFANKTEQRPWQGLIQDDLKSLQNSKKIVVMTRIINH
ncbi:unnamed protein product [Paramecium primaurelia]|uniref:Uncharacterized protein n=1 Tax=Paramecium primaurelia TaxID=5886 RepID=A0A8S1P3Y2_PARPR|nr:unnamed protein product [Paramecium primaurelia]